MTDAEFAELMALQSRTDWFEALIASIYARVLEPGDVAVDGGAHDGLHTYRMADVVGASGRVHAFEVLPPKLAAMRERIAQIPQITLHPRALSDRIGTATFQWVRDAPGLSGLQPRDYEGRTHQIDVIEVETVTIDSLPPEDFEGWRFMKLDLEGGEYRAIRGARERIAEQRPLIVFENARESSAGFYGYAMEDWFGLFDGLGYATFDLWGRAFTRADWIADKMTPYYYIATPRGSEDEAFVETVVPELMLAEVESAQALASQPAA